MRTLIEKESGHPVGHKEQLALRLARNALSRTPLMLWYASPGANPAMRISSGGVLFAATR